MSAEPAGGPYALTLGLALVLFLLEAVFSLTLAAAGSLTRVALHRLAAEGGPGHAFLSHFREASSPHRIAAHLARQLCLVAGTGLLVVALGRAGWRHPLVVGAGVAIVGGLWILELCVARLVAVLDPRRALRYTAAVVRASRWLLFPVVEPVHRLLVRAGGLQSGDEEQREEEQEQEVEALIEVGERSGLLEANEGQMMRGIVELSETAVREIMTPRPDIVALPLDATVAEAREVFLAAGHSRLPVYRQSLDEIVGVLHVRDLLRATANDEAPGAISRQLRQVMFVPETLSVAALLSEMRLKAQIAVVVDEYGGTAGLVTLNDLLEEIVGEIRDEHESAEDEARQDTDGSWLISGAVHVEKLTELFGLEFEERDFDTVGGLVVGALGRLPAPGETLEFRSLRIEVLEIERRRVRLVRVRQLQPAPTAQARV